MIGIWRCSMASLTMTRGGLAAARKSSTTAGLTVMELRKLAHRPMTWAVFALPAVLALVGFPIGYLTARAQGTVPSLMTHISPPGYIPNIFGALSVLGPICVAVLAAGLIGSDYSWGMVRVQVASGAPRARLLGAKLLALALALAAWIVSSIAAATVSSVSVTVVSGHPLSFGR